MEPIDNAVDHVRGGAGGRLILEYGDYECPLSVGLGFVNEYRAARAVAALHGDIRYEALVWRDGRQQDVDVSQLVPGDVVGLRIGGVVPADVRIIEASQLECDEAVLTGESMAAAKTPEPVAGTDSTVDLASCAFMGTVVHQGAGRGIVVATGSATAFGAIAVGPGGATGLFLSYLPMLPSQILLNNLLYDVGQLAIPTDRVDAEVLARPSAWDIAFVRRFMAVFGPVSSLLTS